MVQPDEIIRSKRKTLSISIDGMGRLIVRAPKSFSEERIFAFLKEKEGWIVKKQAERKGAGIQLPPENLHGYTLLLLGEQYTISLYEGQKIGLDSERKILFLPTVKTEERLKKWLKENALRITEKVTEARAKEMNAKYRSVAISPARTRWGVCTHDNALRYSYRLLYVPKDVLDYVVVHELAHTKHKDHSKRFWAEVEAYVPDWKIKRKWLKTHGGLMQLF